MGFGGYLQANTAVDVLIGPFVDDTDGKTAETALTLSQGDIKLSKNGQALAQKNDDTAAAHDANGYYNCELDTTDTNTEGTLTLIVHETGALPVRHDFMVISQAAFASIVTAKDTGYMDINIKAVSEDTTAADNLELACDNYSATRGLSGTALPAAAAGAAGGIPTDSTGKTAFNDPTSASVADAVWDEAIAGHLSAGSTGELMQDIDDEVDYIHTVIDSIAVTGSALNKEAASNTLTVGTQSGGTYASTAIDNGVYHIITAASNEIDVYYEFQIGASGVPTKVNIAGYLKEGAPAGGDTIDLYAYNWGTGWELLQTAIFTGITGIGPDVNHTVGLLSRHVGTAGDDGKVRIRFQAASLEAGTTLNIDYLVVEFAESIAADVASILEDTGTTLQAELDGIQADTEDIQARLPAALVSGRMNSNVAAVNDVAVDGAGTEGDPWGPAA